VKESIVEINGHQYRYRYDPSTQKTEYVGPVGDAPAMAEEDFWRVIKIKAEGEGKSFNALQVIPQYGGDPRLVGLTPPPGGPTGLRRLEDGTITSFVFPTLNAFTPVTVKKNTVNWTMAPKELYDKDTYKTLPRKKKVKEADTILDDFQPYMDMSLQKVSIRAIAQAWKDEYGVDDMTVWQIMTDLSAWPNSFYRTAKNQFTGRREIQSIGRRLEIPVE
jgi:hypothetical protein